MDYTKNTHSAILAATLLFLLSACSPKDPMIPNGTSTSTAGSARTSGYIVANFLTVDQYDSDNDTPICKNGFQVPVSQSRCC
ncbi:hypothetical protein GO755_38560 [Spirosoma sp. HMF4905]|uniref:Lipoprotein n=1 Tax=Spirosoma arboris TaxID=2682092 RepID=A0A7K1SQG1_9BACT|nr:hypothetical protein [Spirosoma arboris]MVM35980.1 hypothetical protein [Spirosoma arboris]